MKRTLEADLFAWKEEKSPTPLLIRGARQVGKTYLIESFGKENFKNIVTLNFELHPEYAACFLSLEPVDIVNAIEAVTKETIELGSTLLFFDELQECPKAIMALRYFKEKMPGLHVIGAGSLLEFALNDEDFRMPVGRVRFLYLRPLSFSEFLENLGFTQLKKRLRTLHIGEKLEEAYHGKLLSLLQNYLALGGMPAVIAEYLESQRLSKCETLQTAILTTFRGDFGKYSKKMPHTHLQNIFSKAPGMIGKWLKYSTLDPDASPVTLRSAIKKLADAGILSLVHATSAAGLPLISHQNEKKSKFLFLDVGLVKRACGLSLALTFDKDLTLINDGQLAEQFVGQELLAYLGKEEEYALFAWIRETPSSSAEIDYLISVDEHLVPIEVKSGATGSLRSLKLFLAEKNVSFGIQISEAPFALKGEILSLPLYLIEELPRLVRELYKKLLQGIPQ